MISLIEPIGQLTDLGRRLRAARLQRNQSMALFADRIGVSVPTLRAMERGLPTVQIGGWANALWALDRLDDLTAVLATKESLLDRARASSKRVRQRAHSRRERAG